MYGLLDSLRISACRHIIRERLSGCNNADGEPVRFSGGSGYLLIRRHSFGQGDIEEHGLLVLSVWVSNLAYRMSTFFQHRNHRITVSQLSACSRKEGRRSFMTFTSFPHPGIERLPSDLVFFYISRIGYVSLSRTTQPVGLLLPIRRPHPPQARQVFPGSILPASRSSSGKSG